MKVYPAMMLKMGDWNYFSVSMKLKDISKHFIFAKSFGEPTVLDEFMQRKLDEKRTMGDMADFVKKDDWFYGSIVVASLDEPPNWYGILPSEEIETKLDLNPESPSIGYVSFSGENRYFILDGQHRVASINHAIKEKLNDKSFEEEEINILIVCEQEGISVQENQIRLRRLFTALNKNAKKTDTITNIIMDEDDLIAIVTRKLVENYDFFSPLGMEAKKNENINMNTKNIIPKTPYFTSLPTLYEMNDKLINSEKFIEIVPFTNKDKKKRPNDLLINEVYLELLKIWKSFVAVFPELADSEKRKLMRELDAPLTSKTESAHGLLRPVIQEYILGYLLIDSLDGNTKSQLDNKQNYQKEFKKLKDIDWDLRKPPFRHLITVSDLDKDGNITFKMASESRAKRVSYLKTILQLMLSESAPDEDDLKEDLDLAKTHLNCTDAEKKQWEKDVRKLMPKN